MTEFAYKKVQQLKASVDVVKKKVLVIYTGGTIGMERSERGLVPAPIRDLVCRFPMLNDKEYHFTEEEEDSFPFPPLALPITFNNFRILYCMMSYDPLLDSSNMDMSDWGIIARDIGRYYQYFDGFVILHGTDTMCYTSSALSFMLENLGKTVIITGAQVPLVELRSDGRTNLVDSLLIAGEYIIPEVCVLFNSTLFRGNRCSKKDSSSMSAFHSPNLPPLATLEIDVNVSWDVIFRNGNLARFQVHVRMDQNVGILRLFPGITPETVRSFLQPPMKGVIMLSFGSGNVPDRNEPILHELKNGIDRGIVIVNCSQCSRGLVTDKYAAGRVLKSIGVVSGADMTPEAALAKLSYLLTFPDLEGDKLNQLLLENLRGELTVIEGVQTSVSPQDDGILNRGWMQAVIRALNLNSGEEVKQIKDYLLPPLMCSAAAKGDIQTLLELRDEGGDFSLPDYDLRTPLHLACSEGNYNAVKMLLEHGASVHSKDRFGHTPLIDAVRFKRYDIIELLVQTGAHVLGSENRSYIVSKMCQAAVENDVESLKAWNLAKADLNMADYNGQTALNVAIRQNNKDVITYIMNSQPEAVHSEVTDSSDVPPSIAAAYEGLKEVVISLNPSQKRRLSNYLIGNDEDSLHEGHKENNCQ